MGDTFKTVNGYNVSYKWGDALASHPEGITNGVNLTNRMDPKDAASVTATETAALAAFHQKYPQIDIWFNYANLDSTTDYQRWSALPAGTRLMLYNAALYPAAIDSYLRYSSDPGGDLKKGGFWVLTAPMRELYRKYTAPSWQGLLAQHPEIVQQGAELQAWMDSQKVGTRNQTKAQQFQALETDWLHQLYGSHYGDTADPWPDILYDQEQWTGMTGTDGQVSQGVRLVLYMLAEDKGNPNDGAATAKTVAAYLPLLFSRYATSSNAGERALFWNGVNTLKIFYQPLLASYQAAHPGSVTPGAGGSPAPGTGPAGTGSAGATGGSGAGLVLLAAGALLLLSGKKK